MSTLNYLMALLNKYLVPLPDSEARDWMTHKSRKWLDSKEV